jgi:hypothetical protein
MEPKEVHRIWAPSEGTWSLWVRPVLFAQMPQYLAASDVSWAPAADGKTLLVLELAGATSVHWGLALAGIGYRPIPLFNACTGPNALVVQEPIQNALYDGAAYLQTLALAADAPPAFLLDQFRQTAMRPIRPGAYDNRWRVFPEDFPSAEVLLSKGFTDVILVRSETGPIQGDLALVMWSWQKAGLVILQKNLEDRSRPRPLSAPRPSWLSRLWQKCQVGQRSPPEGFGHVIPASHG